MRLLYTLPLLPKSLQPTSEENIMLKKKIFLIWTIFNFIEFVIISLCFMVWFCGYKGCGILAP